MNNTIASSISLYTKTENNAIYFYMQEEYHLKKLGIGAYSLKILESATLSKLQNNLFVVSVYDTNYVICANINNCNGLNAILLVEEPLVLQKNTPLFKIIIYSLDKINNSNIITIEKEIDCVLEKNKEIDCVSEKNLDSLENILIEAENTKNPFE